MKFFNTAIFALAFAGFALPHFINVESNQLIEYDGIDKPNVKSKQLIEYDEIDKQIMEISQKTINPLRKRRALRKRRHGSDSDSDENSGSDSNGDGSTDSSSGGDSKSSGEESSGSDSNCDGDSDSSDGSDNESSGSDSDSEDDCPPLQTTCKDYDADKKKCKIEKPESFCSGKVDNDKYYDFTFVNETTGEICGQVSGQSSSNDVSVTACGHTFDIHTSCSSDYTSGYSSKDGYMPQIGDGFKVYDYIIEKFKEKDGYCEYTVCDCNEDCTVPPPKDPPCIPEINTCDGKCGIEINNCGVEIDCGDCCIPSPCGENANCDSINNNPVCSCPPGFVGNPLISCKPDCEESTVTITKTQIRYMTVTYTTTIPGPTTTVNTCDPTTIPGPTTTVTTTTIESCTTPPPECVDDCLVFNALVREDWTYETICDPGCGSDIQGKLMAGGNLNLDPDYTIGDQINPTTDCSINAMEIGGNVDWKSFGRLYGNGIVGGTSNTDSNAITGSSNFAGVCDITFDPNTQNRVLAEFDKYISLSETLRNLPENGPILVNNAGQVEIDFDGYDPDDILVFHTGFSNVVDSFNFVNYQGQVVVFNIEDQHNDVFRATINGGTFPEEHHGKIYWNFHGVNQLSLNIQNNQLYGRFIATDTDVTGLSGTLWGQIIANSFTGNLQINEVECPEVCF